MVAEDGLEAMSLSAQFDSIEQNNRQAVEPSIAVEMSSRKFVVLNSEGRFAKFTDGQIAIISNRREAAQAGN